MQLNNAVNQTTMHHCNKHCTENDKYCNIAKNIATLPLNNATFECNIATHHCIETDNNAPFKKHCNVTPIQCNQTLPCNCQKMQCITTIATEAHNNANYLHYTCSVTPIQSHQTMN